MSSAMLAIHAPSRPTAGSSRTSDATRSGRATASFSATAPPNECPTTTHGACGLADEQLGECGDVGVQCPRRLPRRPAVAEQVGCEDREVGQVLGGQRLPPQAVSGQAMHGQDLRRLLGAVAMHIEVLGHGLDAASSGKEGLSDPRGVMLTCPHRTSRSISTALTEPGIRGVVRVLGGPGTGKTRALIETAAAHHRRRRRPGIRSAADGFGTARHAGARRDHLGPAASR